MLSPEMTAAQSMHHMMEDCLTEAGIKPPVVAAMLKEQGQAAAEGDLAQVRRSLAAQAAMLEKMFHHLFTLAVAGGKHSQDLFERYLRLALKAQTQAMRTQHVLGRLCRETHRETKARQKEAEAKPRQPAAKSSPDQAPAKTAPSISPTRVNLHRRTAVMQSTERALRGGSVWQAGGREALHGLSAPRK